jgi:tRNA dimethylallyltransferase
MTDTFLDRSERAVVAIVGPTASGKSDLAVAVARAFDGEVINADSMQLYRGMDIGTAKLALDERHGVPHHLLDSWPIDKSAAVAEYQVMARKIIDELHGRAVLPVLVGGSGLYVRGALDNLEFPGESPVIRARLRTELADLGSEHLHGRLAECDPAAAAGILPSNGRRIVRALEVIELTGRPFISTMPAFESIYRTITIGLDRADLDDRVVKRVDQMMAGGFLCEVRALSDRGLRTAPTASKALGYRQLLAVLDQHGHVVGDLDEAVATTVRGTIRLARRQRSWFRRDPRICWLDGANPEVIGHALVHLAPRLDQ